MRHIEESPKPRAPQHVIDTLREVDRILSMESAGFSKEVKDEIRLWVETWSRYPIQEVLAWAEGGRGRVESVSYGQRFVSSPRTDRP